MSWVEDDGGRAAAGFKGDADDCVVRAIAIVTGRPYREVYTDLARRMGALGKPKSARNGVVPKVYRRYLSDDVRWPWTSTMHVGQGCIVHLRAEELPAGRIIVRLSRHLAAVIDGVLHDTYDCSRGGTRCVYGYWKEPG